MIDSQPTPPCARGRRALSLRCVLYLYLYLYNAVSYNAGLSNSDGRTDEEKSHLGQLLYVAIVNGLT